MISLEVTNLTKKYNRNVVIDNLSFSHTNGILGIAGSNGSGKSTLMKCLVGLSRSGKGDITWKRKDTVIPNSEIKFHSGFSAPYINLYTELTILENLEFLQEVSGEPDSTDRINELLDYVQMAEFKNQLVKQLSTGQLQRVKLASALIRTPDILFLDEPGSNLDRKGHELVSKIVNDQKSHGKLVVLASNDPDEISLCDQVINLSHS